MTQPFQTQTRGIVICILTLISTFGILHNVDLSYIKPVLEYGIDKPIYGGIFLLLSDIAPILSLLIVKKNNITNNKNVNKTVIIAYIFQNILGLFMANWMKNKLNKINEKHQVEG